MTRVCFMVKVRPELMDDYVERHRAVWPTKLAAIRDAEAARRLAGAFHEVGVRGVVGEGQVIRSTSV